MAARNGDIYRDVCPSVHLERGPHTRAPRCYDGEGSALVYFLRGSKRLLTHRGTGLIRQQKHATSPAETSEYLGTQIRTEIRSGTHSMRLPVMNEEMNAGSLAEARRLGSSNKSRHRQ